MFEWITPLLIAKVILGIIILVLLLTLITRVARAVTGNKDFTFSLPSRAGAAAGTMPVTAPPPQEPARAPPAQRQGHDHGHGHGDGKSKVWKFVFGALRILVVAVLLYLLATFVWRHWGSELKWAWGTATTRPSCGVSASPNCVRPGPKAVKETVTVYRLPEGDTVYTPMAVTDDVCSEKKVPIYPGTRVCLFPPLGDDSIRVLNHRIGTPETEFVQVAEKGPNDKFDSLCTQSLLDDQVVPYKYIPVGSTCN